ncbi:TapY2 family type IVa secretion system protein [Colwellia sp. 1_MG-2023]|uniref:TapY2 family type IVa secretion system protein n=1 Tax=Colwellia sp. 1_MG-2023 TaxID=3062649 RepID=UPI0026E24E93|nr:TapY2 family type IVa secretion system protein [Colwellia sp. 1_MG-2023]MDO6445837.1 TapY2 family type IVa secretion system protein [Colwellia sp. 1_MG-2023]
MKYIFISVLCLFFLLISGNGLANTKVEKTIKTKCFVTLYGGEQTILYQIINESKFNKLADLLTNTSTMTTLSDKKMKVYKVIECVQTADNFKNQLALAVEKITPY